MKDRERNLRNPHFYNFQYWNKFFVNKWMNEYWIQIRGPKLLNQWMNIWMCRTKNQEIKYILVCLMLTWNATQFDKVALSVSSKHWNVAFVFLQLLVISFKWIHLVIRRSGCINNNSKVLYFYWNNICSSCLLLSYFS